jgi:hypothetical protein
MGESNNKPGKKKKTKKYINPRSTEVAEYQRQLR